jgi:TolB-like protein
VTTLVAEDPASPPRISITTRLVTLEGVPRIVWMDSESEAGDDTPGFLSLKLVDDPAVLEARTIARLAGRAADAVAVPGDGPVRPAKRPSGIGGRHRPRRWFRSPHLDLAAPAPPRVAVLPFIDESGRRRAGDIVPLLLVRDLAAFPAVDVLEPGSVRETLLENRVIMEGGVSLAQVEVIRSLLQVDYVVTGTVSDFAEFLGRNGSPRVGFTVRIIDANTNQAVWSSISDNEGDDGVVFFDSGRIRSASALASEMTRPVAAGFAGVR